MKTGYEAEFQQYFSVFERHGLKTKLDDDELGVLLRDIVYGSRWSGLRLLEAMRPAAHYKVAFFDDCNLYHHGEFYEESLLRINDVENCNLKIESVRSEFNYPALDLFFLKDGVEQQISIPKMFVVPDTVPPVFLEWIEELLIKHKSHGHRFVKLDSDIIGNHYHQYFFISNALEKELIDSGLVAVDTIASTLLRDRFQTLEVGSKVLHPKIGSGLVTSIYNLPSSEVVDAYVRLEDSQTYLFHLLDTTYEYEIKDGVHFVDCLISDT